MILPPIVLGDGFITPITQNTIPISPQSMNNWIDQIVEIESKISNFVNACRF
jgi:hypothetical protein